MAGLGMPPRRGARVSDMGALGPVSSPRRRGTHCSASSSRGRWRVGDQPCGDCNRPSPLGERSVRRRAPTPRHVTSGAFLGWAGEARLPWAAITPEFRLDQAFEGSKKQSVLKSKVTGHG